MTSTQRSGIAQMTTLDIGIVGAGAAAFVFSFFGYYTATVSGYTRTTGAWHGFFGWFAAVLALLGAVVLLVAFAVPGQHFAPPYRTVLVVFTVATASVLAALFTSGFDTSHVHALGVGADTGHGYGYWTNLIVIIAGTVLTLARVAPTGGRLPGLLGKLSSIGPAGRER
jgi:hypothetical protein